MATFNPKFRTGLVSLLLLPALLVSACSDGRDEKTDPERQKVDTAAVCQSSMTPQAARYLEELTGRKEFFKSTTELSYAEVAAYLTKWIYGPEENWIMDHGPCVVNGDEDGFENLEIEFSWTEVPEKKWKDLVRTADEDATLYRIGTIGESGEGTAAIYFKCRMPKWQDWQWPDVVVHASLLNVGFPPSPTVERRTAQIAVLHSASRRLVEELKCGETDLAEKPDLRPVPGT